MTDRAHEVSSGLNALNLQEFEKRVLSSHSFPATATLVLSPLAAMVPPPCGVTRPIRERRDGPL